MAHKNIEFIRFISLRGPNIWTYRPALEAWIDIGDLEDSPSHTIPGFYERLSGWLPSLIEHRCSYGERGGFLRRVQEGTWPGHILEHVTLELQNLAGMPGGFGKARSTSRRGVYKVVVRAWHEDIAKDALHVARDLVMAAIEDRPFAVAPEVERLRDRADRLLLGPSTACIVDAAKERKIPSIRLSEGNLVQLGYGVKSRRIWTAETDSTSAIAESIASDKDLTKTLLASCGVPVPDGRMVDSPADAWEAAEDIGLPVVVKPYDGNHGRGVFMDLKTREQVEAAYPSALAEGSGVIVERFVRGTEHRLLVVGNRVVAAAGGETAAVTGDGKSTIRELVAQQLNTDPRRGEEEEFPLDLIRVDDSVPQMELARQGYTAESVPPADKEVIVQRTGNHVCDLTHRVHPEVAAAAALAARIVGLDIAGVDVVAEDIARPLEAQRGAIVEVNAGPGLLMHLKPAIGTPRPVGQAIVDHLFPLGEDGRIPVVGIAGSKGKTTVARLLSRLLQMEGRKVGVACSNGFFLDHRRILQIDSANWAGAHNVLMNRTIDVAICENGNRSILGEGLAYDRCRIGIVTNIDPADTAPDFDILDAEQLWNTVRSQVDVVLPGGVAVLNADDAEVARLATLSDGEVVFFGRNPDTPAMAEHRAQGKRAVYVRSGRVVLGEGGNENSLVDVKTVPMTAGGEATAQIENVLAAVAAAWALGVPLALIRAGIETFDLAQPDAPVGRAAKSKTPTTKKTKA